MLLSRGEQVIPFSEKPAQLLRLFLKEPNKIHTKSSLLEIVWADRVVTEQVVFQNISYLRAKFGDDAIKTFPKKGYQWQLSATIVEEPIEAPECVLKNSSPSTAINKSKLLSLYTSNKKAIYIVALGLSLLCLSLMSFVLITHDQNTRSTVAPLGIKLINAGQSLKSGKIISVSGSPQALFDSPDVLWAKHTSERNQLLIGTKFYAVGQQVALRFHIQGAERGWQDYLLGNSRIEAMSKLEHLLTQLSSSRYFEASKANTALAELMTLNDDVQSYELVSTQRIKLLFQLSDFDKANTLIEQLLTENPSMLRKGLLYLLKTQISSWNRDDDTAQESITKALAIFKTLNLAQLEAQALIEAAWVHLAKQSFRQGIQVLNQAASRARSANEPLLEFTAHLNQAFMASKAGLTELSYAQVGFANELMKLHQLERVHQTQIDKTAAWMSQSKEQRLSHYENILSRPFSLQYEQYFYVAANAVRDYFIDEQNWLAASATIRPWQRESFQLLSQARISLAEKNIAHGVSKAKNAFRVAKLDHHKVDALDAALLLLQQGDILTHSESNELIMYINQHASNRWREQNRRDWELIRQGSH
ncbi:winged helix-turn-helix domain-containing protein [Pseudoalteromonas sp. YIC-656]|uniref:winged helix-turn-helix domain-containing protein n=1 Tax=Pseudoalteromonas pernae TaxID=3118054 RepID=UPI003242D95B